MTSNWDVSLVVFQRNVGDLAKVAWGDDPTSITLQPGTIQPAYGTIYWPVGNRAERDDDHPALQDFLRDYEPPRVEVCNLKAGEAVKGAVYNSVSNSVDRIVCGSAGWGGGWAAYWAAYWAVTWPVDQTVGWTIGANPELPEHPALQDFLRGTDPQ